MVMLGIAAFNESATSSIEAWYLERHPADPTTGAEAEELNLFKTSMWATIATTGALLVTLLFTELKKRYSTK